jgi:hypothetical protein
MNNFYANLKTENCGFCCCDAKRPKDLIVFRARHFINLFLSLKSFSNSFLPFQTKRIENFSVSFDVFSLQVVEKSASTTNKNQQTTP